MSRYLVLDSNYLCYRNYYAFGELSHNDIPTGVVFGFMKDIQYLQDFHGTNKIVFCFDDGKSLRCKICKTYKTKRLMRTEEEEEKVDILRQQIHLLKTEYLKELDYNNVFYQNGYEADDVIASVVINLDKSKHEAIIVSSDRDLLQLLAHKVSIWNPHRKEMLTKKGFEQEWQIGPEQWHLVKAIAGCTTDDVPGIEGVGEITAAKFLRGELKKDSKARIAIMDGESVWKDNIKVIKLPYQGIKKFSIKEDDTSAQKWDALANKLGMKSLLRSNGQAISTAARGFF